MLRCSARWMAMESECVSGAVTTNGWRLHNAQAVNSRLYAPQTTAQPGWFPSAHRASSVLSAMGPTSV